jgi:flagellum-specific peptidoglycan hydrolase FlgJ
VTLAILANRPSSVPGDVKPTGMSMHREEVFIEKMAEEATRLNEEYGIRPSVTIAQAILESNWGQSGLAQEEQNYFGIKGGSESPQYATNEYTDEWIEIEASFRSYDSWEESMEDYAKLLANGTAWDSELYHGVIEADHYVEAAQALQEAGYATDPDYSEKVISIVERYDLDRFDE